eukprot:2710925-Alexandrium_andersonii.AAC.1
MVGKLTCKPTGCAGDQRPVLARLRAWGRGAATEGQKVGEMRWLSQALPVALERPRASEPICAKRGNRPNRPSADPATLAQH